MKLFDLTADEVRGTLRIDAKYHLAHHHPVLSRIRQGAWAARSIREVFGEGAAWMPNRFTRVWAESRVYGKALLAPYDNFRYEPWSESFLSQSEVKEYTRAEVRRGTLLIVRSGRNCGPVTMVDSFTEQFTVSDDMIRVDCGESLEKFYLYAFLSSPTGQDILRRDRNGSVIDHLGPDQVATFAYPRLGDELVRKVSVAFRSAFLKRELGRLALARVKRAYSDLFGLMNDGPRSVLTRSRRFTVSSADLGGRMDAEPFSPEYAKIRSEIISTGGRTLGSIADVLRPAGRYKTNYVESAEHGVPLMSGRQIAQYKPIALRLMNVSQFKNPESFILKEGMTMLTADGRAEENLADCVLVARDRDGWGASGHVHRIVPKPDIAAGLVYLACSSAAAQAQLKALATGSVVDALSESDVASIVVPYSDCVPAKRLGLKAKRIWDLFARANELEHEAVALIEGALVA